jgi:phosphoribosylformylglycinamidine cyclo-ligase
LIREAAGMSRQEMRATFNMGIGMVLVVPADRAADVIARASVAGTPARTIGRTVAGTGIHFRR